MGNRKKKERKKIKLWTLDTETRGLFGGIFRAGAYDGEHYHCGNTFLEVAKQILLSANEEEEQHIYIHNLDFDLAKFAPELFSKDTINFSDSIIINGNVVTISTTNFIFHDSLRLLVGSLDSLCKSFGVEHGKMDLTQELIKHGYKDKDEYFNNIPADDPVLNEYLRLDCVSLYEIIELLEQVSGVDLEDLVYCPTTPSLAMKVFKSRFKEDFETATSTFFLDDYGKLIEDFIRGGYCGGRTEVFTPYIENGKHYDVNSLYPYVMKKFCFPVGEYQYYEDKEAEEKWNFWRRRKVGGGFIRCDIYVPDMFIPPLPLKTMGKLMFPVGNLSGIWTFVEIEKALELGCEIKKIYGMVYFRMMKPIFKKYVEYFEPIKANSKGAKREFAKRMLNTLYGKFGMRRDRTTFVDISQLTELEKEELPIIKHCYSKFISGVEFLETVTHSKADYIQPQISAYVTSYARIALLEGLMEQDSKGVVAYCDTDSIASTATMPDDMVHDSEFGKWDLEGIIEKGIFLQPKFYAEKKAEGSYNPLKDKAFVIKAKGIPKEIMDKKLDWDFYELTLEQLKSGDVNYITIYEGYKARKKFMTMLKENVHLETPRILRKNINLIAMQKRQMKYAENTSLPHVFNEFNLLSPSSYQVDPVMIEEFLGIPMDSDYILEVIREHGKIQYISPDSKYFMLYATIPKKYIELYFDSKGNTIEEFCKKTGWEEIELLYEMGGLR